MNLEEPLIDKKVVYQGRYLRTEEHRVRLPDGKEAIREIVSPPDAVGILPVDPHGFVYLVRQYRPAIGRITLEIPAGLFEPGENAVETARRECMEEVGQRPGRVDFLFSYYHSVGFSTGKIEVYLGQDLTPCSQVHGDPGEFLEVIRLPILQLYEQVAGREVIDSKTLLAVLWYRHVYGSS